MTDPLKDAYDLHVHTAPDCIPRKLSDEEMAERGRRAGMAGCVLKCHAAPTAGRAAILKRRYPDFDMIGSIALNKSVGGINSEAVLAAAKMGARYLWFPTADAWAYRRSQGKQNREDWLSAGNSDGGVKDETLEVLRIAKEYDMVVGTGHIGTEESLTLAETACALGIKRICMTHVTLPVCQMTLPQLKQAVSFGAMLEYSYCHILSGKCSLETVADQIRYIGAEHVILSSDLGQADNPYPDEGLREFADRLAKRGIRNQELSMMLRENPRKLLYG